MRDYKSAIYNPKQEEELLPLFKMEGFPGKGVGTLPLYILIVTSPKGLFRDNPPPSSWFFRIWHAV